MNPAILLEQRTQRLREAFAAEPALILERTCPPRNYGASQMVQLWWMAPVVGDRPRKGGVIAEWPWADAGDWVRGIADLFAELRRLRKAHTALQVSGGVDWDSEIIPRAGAKVE